MVHLEDLGGKKVSALNNFIGGGGEADRLSPMGGDPSTSYCKKGGEGAVGSFFSAKKKGLASLPSTKLTYRKKGYGGGRGDLSIRGRKKKKKGSATTEQLSVEKLAVGEPMPQKEKKGGGRVFLPMRARVFFVAFWKEGKKRGRA